MPQQTTDAPSKATVWLVNHRFGKDGNVTAFADREGALKEVRTIVSENYDVDDGEEIEQLSKIDELTEENNTIDMGDCSVSLTEVEIYAAPLPGFWLVIHSWDANIETTLCPDRETAIIEGRECLATHYQNDEEHADNLQEAEDSLDNDAGDLAITLDSGDIHIERIVPIAPRRQADVREEGEGG